MTRRNPIAAPSLDAWEFVTPVVARLLDRYTFDSEARAPRADVVPRSVAEVLELPRRGLRTWHVTDDPKRVLRVLASESDPSRVLQHGDLGGGLYFSAATLLWASRSRKRWQWERTLTDDERVRVLRVLDGEVEEQYAQGRVTRTEYEYARRGVDAALDHPGSVESFRHALYALNAQPYGLDPEEMLRRARLPPPEQPDVVEAVLRGRFLNLDAFGSADVKLQPLVEEWVRYQPRDLVTRAFRAHGGRTELRNSWLASLGYSGAFASGWSHSPQIVVWNFEAIRAFGSWRASRPVPR